jgi:hypothetical protein
MKVGVVGVGGCWIVKNHNATDSPRDLDEIVLALIVIWR